jgi:hypothetical protein
MVAILLIFTLNFVILNYFLQNIPASSIRDAKVHFFFAQCTIVEKYFRIFKDLKKMMI